MSTNKQTAVVLSSCFSSKTNPRKKPAFIFWQKLTGLLFVFCSFLIKLNAQVVINEVTPDPGNYDGQGAEWIELYNSGATPADVGCWVLTDGEEVVVIPSGTTIPSHGFLMIYNSDFFNCATCNWTGWVPGPNVLVLDVKTCNCTNQSSCFAVTFENTGGGGNPNDNDGERVALFDATATIQDAIYYGSGSRVNAGAAIPESQLAGTDGPSDIISGTNIVGNAATGCTLPASNDYTIPAVPATPKTSNGTFEYTGQNPIGCSTSISRGTDGGSSWILDNWPTPGVSNTAVDYTVLLKNITDNTTIYTYSVTNDASTPSTVSSVVDICAGKQIGVEVVVNNYNMVFNDIDGDAGLLVSDGTNLDITGGTTVTNAAFSETVSGGTSTLTYNSPAINSTSTLSFEVKENTQSCDIVNAAGPACLGASGKITGCGGAAECFIQNSVTLRVANAITAISYTCSNGLVTVTTVPATNFGSYNLFLDNSVDNTLDRTFVVSSSPFTFQVSQGVAANYSLAVTGAQSPSCAAVPAITGGPICVFAPPCPTFADNATCTNTAPYCPGSVLNFGLDASTSTNLPNGGTVQWVIDTDNDGDVYDEAASSVIATQSIVNGPAIPSGSPKLNEVLFDATQESGTTNGEAIEIAGTPGTNIGCSYISDGDFIVQLPSTAVIPASGFYVIGGNSYTPQSGQPAANLTTAATSGLMNLTNSSTSNGEFVGYFSSANTFVNGVAWGNPPSGNANAPASSGAPSIIVAGSGCSTPTGTAVQTNIQSNAGSFVSLGNITTTDEKSIELSTDLTGTWQLSAAPGSTVNTLGSSNRGSTISLLPTCATYTIPNSACNTTLNIKPRISPDQTGCSPGSAMPTLATKTFVITCPTASLSGQSAICSGASASMDVSLTNVPASCTMATITYKINGGADIVVGPLTISSNKVTITGLMTSGTYTLTNVAFSGGGCSACSAALSGSYVITVATNPAPPTAAATQIVCNGESTNITATGDGDIQWYSNVGLTTLVGSGASLPVTLTSNTTYYAVVVNTDNGCVSTGTPVMLTVAPLPMAATTSPVSFCTGSPLILNGTANFVAPATSIASTIWSTTSTNGFTSTMLNPTVTGTAVSTDAGVYTLYVSDNNGCYSTANATVTVNGLPSLAGGPVCVGSTITLTGSGTPALVLPYVSSNTGVATVTAGGVVTGISAGMANITYTDANGCQAVASVTVNGLPSLAGGPVCVGSTITLTGSGTPALVLPYVSSNTGVATVTAGGVVTGISAGMANITYTDANGCQAVASVTVNGLPIATVSPNTQTICSGTPISTIVLTSSISGTTYNWVRDNSVLVTGIGSSGTGNISGILTNTTSSIETVTFTITPTANGCPGLPIMATVVVKPLPNVDATNSSQTVCSGSGITTIGLSSSVPGTVFNWSRTNALVTGIPGTGSGNISGSLAHFSNSPQTVLFTITPIANGCTGVPTTATVVVNPVPNVSTSIQNQSICSGASISTIVLTSTTTGTTFNWTRDNTIAVTGIPANGTGDISGSLTNTTTVPVTVNFAITPTANGCPGTPINAKVIVFPVPTGSATPVVQEICSGANMTPIVLAPDASTSSFAWVRDMTSEVVGIPNMGPGNQISGPLTNTTSGPVTVTFSITPKFGGCFGPPLTASVMVSNNAVPPAPATFCFQSFCVGDSPTVASLIPNGPNYHWYTMATGGIPLPDATPLVDGATYYLSQTVSGCEPNRIAVMVNVRTAPPGKTCIGGCSN